MVTWKKFLIGSSIVFIDLTIYAFLGLIMLGYEDHFYDNENRSEYWSLASMNFGQKVAYIGLYIWFGINIIVLLYILFKFMKQIKEIYFK